MLKDLKRCLFQKLGIGIICVIFRKEDSFGIAAEKRLKNFDFAAPSITFFKALFSFLSDADAYQQHTIPK